MWLFHCQSCIAPEARDKNILATFAAWMKPLWVILIVSALIGSAFTAEPQAGNKQFWRVGGANQRSERDMLDASVWATDAGSGYAQCCSGRCDRSRLGKAQEVARVRLI